MSTPSISKSRHVSQKASSFTESVIREMTREALKHGAVNLSQGFPDFSAPEDIKRKAMEAIAADVNQYAITWGSKDFRDAIARKTKWYPVSYTHLRAHETPEHLVCRLLLEKKKKT